MIVCNNRRKRPNSNLYNGIFLWSRPSSSAQLRRRQLADQRRREFFEAMVDRVLAEAMRTLARRPKTIKFQRRNVVDCSASFAARANCSSSHGETPFSLAPTSRAHLTYSRRRLTDHFGGGLAAIALRLLVLSASLRIFARGDFFCC